MSAPALPLNHLSGTAREQGWREGLLVAAAEALRLLPNPQWLQRCHEAAGGGQGGETPQECHGSP